LAKFIIGLQTSSLRGAEEEFRRETPQKHKNAIAIRRNLPEPVPRKNTPSEKRIVTYPQRHKCDSSQHPIAANECLRFAAKPPNLKIAIPQNHIRGSMPVISFLNQKGGVGKTTLAIHVADALTRRKHKVLVVDADPQGSALDWAAARQGEPRFPVIGLPKASIHKELPVIAKGFDWVVIDGPPRVYDVARSAIMASDAVFIPVQPSPYDVWAANEILELFKDADVYRPDVKRAFVINRKIANTAIGRDVNEALSEYKLPVLNAAICQRVSFADSATLGKTVFDNDPEGLAAKEILAVVKEIERFVG